jgi:hypothetical protein
VTVTVSLTSEVELEVELPRPSPSDIHVSVLLRRESREAREGTLPEAHRSEIAVAIGIGVSCGVTARVEDLIWARQSRPVRVRDRSAIRVPSPETSSAAPCV